MKYSEDTIKELADMLDSGVSVYLDKKTGEVIWYPEEAEYDDPDGMFTELLEKIEANQDDYIKFFSMDSNRAYRVMEDFAASKVPQNFREKLDQALNGAKPFRNFKMLIDNSEFRQDWFDFKLEKNMEEVRLRIESETEQDQTQ